MPLSPSDTRCWIAPEPTVVLERSNRIADGACHVARYTMAPRILSIVVCVPHSRTSTFSRLSEGCPATPYRGASRRGTQQIGEPRERPNRRGLHPRTIETDVQDQPTKRTVAADHASEDFEIRVDETTLRHPERQRRPDRTTAAVINIVPGGAVVRLRWDGAARRRRTRATDVFRAPRRSDRRPAPPAPTGPVNSAPGDVTVRGACRRGAARVDADATCTRARPGIDCSTRSHRGPRSACERPAGRTERRRRRAGILDGSQTPAAHDAFGSHVDGRRT